MFSEPIRLRVPMEVFLKMTKGQLKNNYQYLLVYITGIKITDEQMQTLNISRHESLPKWNYTLFPD